MSGGSLLDDADSEYDAPELQPRRRPVAARPREALDAARPGRPAARASARVADGALRDLTGDWDHWPAGSLEWTPDGSALVLVGRRGRPRAGVPARRRQRRVHPADGRRLRLLRRAGLARRAPRLRDAHVVRRAAPAGPPRRDHARPGVRCRCAGRARRPALPGRLEEVETTAEDGTRVRAWLALPDDASADEPGPAAALDPRRPAGLVERLVVALEPVAGGRAGVRRAAARPGAVHRLRAGLHRAAAGATGARRRTPT